MEKLQVEIIKNEAIIDIKLSGSFYRRVQHSLHVLAAVEGEEALTNLVDKINSETPDEELSDWENAVQTLMILCSEVEAKAKQQGHTEMVDIDDVTSTTTEAPPANL
jgi:hypothetical protein